MNPIGMIFRLYFTWQSRNKSLNELISQSEASGKTILDGLKDKSDTPANREKLRHIIGIERWGQRRLKTLLGEPPLTDEYNGYQPAESLDFKALRAEFKSTRAETAKLLRTLQKKGLAKTGQAYHNSMGEIPITVWAGYLTMHANMEYKRIK
ncbi:MAG: DinB family protein [Caldilineaceae bacterium]|nr:DinB family protein [Caldilineaceae bacterium]